MKGSKMNKRKISIWILMVLLLLSSTACMREKKTEQGLIQKEVEQEQKKNTNIPKETMEEKATTTPTQTPVSTKIITESGKGKKREAIKLNHTYKTRLREVDKVDCPTFSFEYSDNWEITKEETHQDSWVEKDVLENDRGVTITYTDYDSKYGLGSEGRFMYQTKFSKVADSSFEPSYIGTAEDTLSDIGACMVAKVKTVGEAYMDTDTDYTKIDGAVYYAVVPKSYAGMHDVVGMAGLYTACSFEYPVLYSFLAESPDGKFTKEEEKEIIEILSSFREVFN